MAKKIIRKKTVTYDKLNHSLVPKHTKLSEKDKKELLDKLKITLQEMPKIGNKDPAIRHLDVKEGDIILIERQNPILGTTIYYRGVIDE
ncbi:DNA-directed RNA polymerase subunit H [Candidatus Woesearchaeota archaeon CG11_big_fil_rev_8_21_14_0_20_43_8]|nr:MAG: DNA-directed RNA polymerase subunit H [Candidatus Woesearchaeota archaeon CG11_big_fil_rev_8_21_14_0_20_43_8]